MFIGLHSMVLGLLATRIVGNAVVQSSCVCQLFGSQCQLLALIDLVLSGI